MKNRSKPAQRQPRRMPKIERRSAERPPVSSEELHRRLDEWYRQLTEVSHAVLARTA